MTGRRVQALSPATAASMLRTPAGQSRGACSPTAPRPRAPGRGHATSGSGRRGVAKKSLPLRRLRTSFPVSQTVPSQGSLRRLARRGGVRRIAGGVYQEMRQTLVSFVTGVVHDAITVAEHCRRMTITVNNILLVLKHRNITLYGFGTGHLTRHLTSPAVRRLRRAPCREAIETAARRAADRRASRAAAAAAPSNNDVAEAGPSDGDAAPAASASTESSESSGAEVISPARKAESPAALPAGDDFADLSLERRQEIQDALGWYVGEAGTAPVQLAALQQRLAADMAFGEAAPRPCSLGELRAALCAMEADGEDAPVLLVRAPSGDVVHFTF